MKQPILLAGYGAAPIHAIEHLLSENYIPSEIGLLTHDRADNQFLIQFAQGRGIEVSTLRVKDPACLDWIQARGFEALVSLYFRHIIPANVLDHFEGRAMNLHAGRLPQYRGCWSTPWSIINGEVFAGFTYHYMTAGIDEGRIIYEKTVGIDHRSDTAFSIYHRVLRYAMERFFYAFQQFNEDVEGERQQGIARYYPRQIPYDGYIDPSWPYVQVERFIRAMYFPPFKGAMLKLPDGTEREILSMEDYHRCLKS